MDKWLSTALLALEPVDKMGQQGNKLVTMVCHFERLGGHKMPQVKIQTFPTKAD